MEWMTALALGAVTMYVVWKYDKRERLQAEREQLQNEKRRVQYDLRFPTLSRWHPKGDSFSIHVFADFEQMLVVNETSDYNYHHTRVYNLRRLDGPTWEVREEGASRERSRAHAAAMRARGNVWSERSDKEMEAELETVEWTPCQYSDTIEPKYQLFLHNRDPSAATFQGRLVEMAVENDYVRGTESPVIRRARR